jgi:DNA primase
MSAPSDFKETLRQQADIVRIVGEYVKLRKSGAQNYAGLCPFHGEKTPSFSVHATRQFYHCFGCGASGDVFSFVQKVENISFPEAVRLIAQKLGVAMPKIGFSSPEEARDAKLRMALLDVHERATEFFERCLQRPEGARARDYLKGRGLDEETIARFRIGFAPDSGFLLRDALRNEFDEETLRESGLFSWKEEVRQPSATRHQQDRIPSDQRATTHRVVSGQPAPNLQPAAMYSKFRNRVMFPIANEQGKMIAFTGRTLSSDEKSGPKYLNSPETRIYSKSRVLFNLQNAKEAIRSLEYSILVEGQMDCIAVYSAGFHNVIASSGTAFTELQAKLLGRFSKNIFVNFDPDTAGARATERTLGLLVEEEFIIRVVTLETGFDPDLFIRRQGKEAYQEALKHSQKYFDYLIERARAQFGTRNAESKVKAVNYLLPHVQKVPSLIARDELALEIAQKLGIDSAAVRSELKHAATSRARSAMSTSADIQVTSAERLLIHALASAREMQAGENRNSARDGAEEEFDPARQARFALESERLYEGLATESLLLRMLGTEGGDPLEAASNEEERRLLASILIHDQEELTPVTVEGAIRALRRIVLRRRLEEVQRFLARPGLSMEEKQRLLQEKVRLKRALMDPGLDEAAGRAS